MFVLTYFLLAAGALVAVGNWIGMIRWYTRKQTTSLIPLLGGVLGFFGCVAHPGIHWAWGFLALGLDPWWLSMTGIPKCFEAIFHKREPG